MIRTVSDEALFWSWMLFQPNAQILTVDRWGFNN